MAAVPPRGTADISSTRRRGHVATWREPCDASGPDVTPGMAAARAGIVQEGVVGETRMVLENGSSRGQSEGSALVALG